MTRIDNDPTLPDGDRASRGPEEIAVGSQIDDYVIRSHIATGGFGSVFRAEHLRLGRTVALKVLHRELATSPELLARFEREARAVNVINHPNVVDIFDFGQIDDRPYFAMEYLTGHDLGHHVSLHGPLSLDQVRPILEPLCSALAAAHERRIVHRDVTPANVFLATRGDRDPAPDSDDRPAPENRVVLLDFGIAKLLGDDAERLTAMQQRIGTPTWMAPEQLLTGEVDARADIYTVGALTYYMLTRHQPFEDEAPELILELHSYGRQPRPSDIVNLPRAVDDVVVRAMAVEPDARFPTIGEFFDAFEAARREGSEPARKSSSRIEAGSPEPREGGAPTAAARDGNAVHRPRRGVGLHLEIIVGHNELETISDEMLEITDEFLFTGDRFLRQRGFVPGAETGNSIFLVLPLAPVEADLTDPHPANSTSETTIEQRRQAVDTARALLDVLRDQDPHTFPVRAVITLHVDDVFVAARRVRGGALTRLSSWAHAPVSRDLDAPYRIIGTAPVFQDLTLDDALQQLPDGRYSLAASPGPATTSRVTTSS